MKLNNVRPDFAPRGNLSLKPWIANDQGIKLPAAARAARRWRQSRPTVTQIKALARQVGAVIPRQNMKDKSGATVMDPKTQVTSVHGHSVLDLALLPLEANFALPLVHEIAGPNDRAMLDIAVAAETNLVGDSGAHGGGGRARSRQLAQHHDGRGGGDRRAEARRAGALPARPR